MFHVPNDYRIRGTSFRSSDDSYGNNGTFTFEREGVQIFTIASDGEGWEHVSVSINKRRCPNWEIMCIVKDLFWDPEDVVVQFHPAKSQYVNNHPFVLHLWRSTTYEFITPPTILVGIKL